MLFTFPSRYCSTIGHQVVFRLGGWSPRLPTGLLVSGGTLDPRCLQSVSLTWLSHSVAGLPMPFCYQFLHVMRVRTPKILRPSVWPPPRSLATTNGISVDVFSSPYLDVSVQAVPHVRLFYSPYVTPKGGLPHSDISGSKLICSSPKLFAAYHVLHRLLMPRHSPCALLCLISSAEASYRSHPSPRLRRTAECSLAPLCLLSNSNPLALGFEFVLRFKH